MPRRRASDVFGLERRDLGDTIVWLDLAKDHQQQATLAVLEELVRNGDVSLLVPRIVVDEFQSAEMCSFINYFKRFDNFISGVAGRGAWSIRKLRRNIGNVKS